MMKNTLWSANYERGELMRDYSRQMIPVFQGENGKEAYIRILKAKSKQKKYDLKAEQEKAKRDLKERGINV